jgi:hypothetical protein
MWKLIGVAVLAGVVYVGFVVVQRSDMREQFNTCLAAGYSIADRATNGDGEARNARYDIEAVRCARRIERDWQTCWPMGDDYRGDPAFCKRAK